jgi:hypothetical protein
MVPIRWLPPLLVGLLHPAVAGAAGGAHVIDDSAVETPGTCHFEQWLTHASGEAWLANVAPACTASSHPNLEMGGALSHGWSGRTDDTILALTPKLALRDGARGIGLALDASVGLSIDSGRFEIGRAHV